MNNAFLDISQYDSKLQTYLNNNVVYFKNKTTQTDPPNEDQGLIYVMNAYPDNTDIKILYGAVYRKNNQLIYTNPTIEALSTKDYNFYYPEMFENKNVYLNNTVYRIIKTPTKQYGKGINNMNTKLILANYSNSPTEPILPNYSSMPVMFATFNNDYCTIDEGIHTLKSNTKIRSIPVSKNFWLLRDTSTRKIRYYIGYKYFVCGQVISIIKKGRSLPLTINFDSKMEYILYEHYQNEVKQTI